MRDAANKPQTDPTSEPVAPPEGTPTPDPADLGTAYGMELSIDPTAKRAPAEEDVADPLGWIRRWVDHHKPA